jgi:uncharacterized membrane protein
MFVHFPVAFYIAVPILDLLTRLHPDRALVYTGTLLLIGAFAATLPAVATGLVDWFQMIGGSKKRRTATKHMVLQLVTAAFFVLAFALRWSHRRQGQAEWGWIAIEVLGALVLVVAQWLGGKLVYQMAMRVRTGRPTAATEGGGQTRQAS